ncbi:MAG TPA: tetratricopeptide repeat protein, partial [Elusimicrobiales bacterium]|nr:tetratricopeptide repeat protein [Elusimicrobiales bacterium]
TAAGKWLASIELALHNIFFYIGKTIFPFQLSPLYPAPAFGDGLAQPVRFWFELAALFFIALSCWLLRHKQRAALFGAVFFLIALSPALQLVPIGWAAAADRYTYLASLGLTFGASRLLFDFYEKAGAFQRAITRLSVLAVLLAYAALSFTGCFIWKNSATLWNRVLRFYPNSGIALTNRGKALAQEGRLQEAVKDFEKALKTDPNSVIFLSNSATALARLGRFEEALRNISRAIALMPDAAPIYNNRGAVYLLSGRADLALKDFQMAVNLQPGYANARNNLETAAQLSKKSRPSLPKPD